MEKEIADLRRKLASNPMDQEQSTDTHAGDDLSQCSEEVFSRRASATVDRPRPISVPAEQHPSMATPLTMQRDGSILSQDENTPWRLEDISLSRARVSRAAVLIDLSPARLELNLCFPSLGVSARRSPVLRCSAMLSMSSQVLRFVDFLFLLFLWAFSDTVHIHLLAISSTMQ